MKHWESIKMNNYGLSVSIFVEQNPFGSVKSVTYNHLGPYKMLYQKCFYSCSSSYYKNAQWGVSIIKIYGCIVFYTSQGHIWMFCLRPNFDDATWGINNHHYKMRRQRT
jgi:hypothetical protein